MCQLIPAGEEEPLFLVREKNQRLALSAGQIRRLLKKWCIAAAINPRSYTPHCLRRGGLNWAHDAELTQESLKALGDRSSNTYQRYLDLGFDSRVKSGCRMKQFIENSSGHFLQTKEKKIKECADKNNGGGQGMADSHPAVVPVPQDGTEMVVHQEVSLQRCYHPQHYSRTVNRDRRPGLTSTVAVYQKDKS